MSEQIMWAVKGPGGKLLPAEYGETERHAWRLLAASFDAECHDYWIVAMQRNGYRCIRVKVTEVTDNG